LPTKSRMQVVVITMIEGEWYACQHIYPVLAHYFPSATPERIGSKEYYVALCGSWFDEPGLDDFWGDMPYCQQCLSITVSALVEYES